MKRCPWPDKRKLTHREAIANARTVNARAYDGRIVHQYRCPAGGHWHIGHPVPRRANA